MRGNVCQKTTGGSLVGAAKGREIGRGETGGGEI